MNAGIFDIAPEKYYADDLDEQITLNATVAKALIKASPAHARTVHPRLNPEHTQKEASRFDIGTAAHEVFLLGNDDLVHVVDADDWRKQDAKKVRDRARAEGLVPLLRKEWVRVSAMLTALRVQVPKLDCSPAMFVDGEAERTLIWQDQGVWCRARLDWLHDDYSACDDLKTCQSASPLAWASRTLFTIQAEIQAVMTIRGIKAVTGRTSEFRFLACETKPPYGISPVRLGPSAIAMANHEIDRALEQWKRCLETDTWPSYPRAIVDAEPPSWRESEMWAAESIADEVAA